MNYPFLIVVALAGIALGMYLAQRPSVASRGGGRRKANEGSTAEPLDCIQDEQTAKKMENKQKILEFVQTNGKIQNNDVEKLAGVSNATAERYLNELEKEGKLAQHGAIGPDVFYTAK